MHEETDRAFTEDKYHELFNSILVSSSGEAQHLLGMISQAQLEEILKKNNCEIFRNAVINGLLDVINQLLARVSVELQQRMLRVSLSKLINVNFRNFNQIN